MSPASEGPKARRAPDVDETLAARLVAEQHPDFEGRVRMLARGWDNCVFRLGDDLVVRLPRRVEAAELMRNELHWLPRLADRLSTRIPRPIRRGEPTSYYPWSWAVLPYLAGQVALELPTSERADLADDLAGFLHELHVPAPADAPVNPVRGVPLATRSAAVEDRLATGAFERADDLRAIWAEAVAAPADDGPPLWLHGDPHPGNLLVNQGSAPSRRTAARTGIPGARAGTPSTLCALAGTHSTPSTPGAPATATRLAAVIDFGDLTSGDPATDLAFAWTVFDAPGRARFRARVNDLDHPGDEVWMRARGWALNLGTAIVLSPHSDDALREMGRHALQQLLAEL